MTGMLLRILLLALCCTLVSCKDLVEKYKRSNSGISARDKKVLFDFRTAAAASHITIDSSTERQVFSVVPPASCPVVTGQPQPALRIASVVNGSFTYAAEQETAYLITGLPCGWPNKVVVLAAGKVQASSDTPYSVIAATVDLNRDDKNELLLVGETTHNGELSREASLQTFEKNALHPLESFGIVYHDGCSALSGINETQRKELIARGRSPYVEAVVIYDLPHAGQEMPSFTAERYRAPCPTSPDRPLSNWQLVLPK